MPFKDELFPKRISLNGTGGPAFEVDIVASNSGIEWRNLITSMPRWEFEVSHAARLQTEWEPLRAFFINMMGRYYSFRYWDHLDYIVDDTEGVFVATNTSPSGWQMYKAYQFGSQTFYRKITKPISGTISVTGGSGVTIDYDTGIVYCTGTPTSWAGQFHVHARFNMRAMVAETINRQEDGSYLVGWSSIPIVEVKEAD